MIMLDLRLSLCDLPPASIGSSYRGPLPMAVKRFRAKLPEHDRSLVQSWEHEFIDYLLDDILEGVAKPLRLIELCLAYPNAALTEMVEMFPWEDGLKRPHRWKEDWVADHLCSLLAADVMLPASIVAVLADRGAPKYEFNEMAFAVTPERLRLGWKDFKRQQGLWAQALTILDDEVGASVAGEGVDYGVIPMAEVALNEITTQDVELEIDLQLIGRRLSDNITEMLEELHAAKPVDGYRPVAWHNVFWNLISEYVRLRLSLEVRDPLLDTDGELADHIKANYQEVKSVSRPAVLRRRQNLSAACAKLIEERFWEKFSGSREQAGPRITHVIEEAYP